LKTVDKVADVGEGSAVVFGLRKLENVFTVAGIIAYSQTQHKGKYLRLHNT